MTTAFKFSAALTERGWIAPAHAVADDLGHLVYLGVEPKRDEPHWEVVGGWLLPGFPNAHSHAFQFAMAGLAEHKSVEGGADDFWSWRENMYAIAQTVEPEDAEAIAACLYAEMLTNGYTSVLEFHYLHQGQGGTPYDLVEEMSLRHIAAARAAGIELTLVPVYYRNGNFAMPPSRRQLRFTFPSVQVYRNLLERVARAAASSPDVVVGHGIHSLRACDEGEAVQILSDALTNGPRHLHIAEQAREVEDCVRHWGQRPLEWLLSHVALGPEHSLVHGTHATINEVTGIAHRGAQIVLCPTTEGNLGDGIFPLTDFWSAGGRWAIGTDSHVGLWPFEELRWADYVQRLATQKRLTLCYKAGDDGGVRLFHEAWTSGRQSVGRQGEHYFAIGAPLTGMVVDATHPVVADLPAARRLAGIVYAGTPRILLGTIAKGRWIVRDGSHVDATNIRARYAQALARIRSRPTT